jgi:hypothetical protein
MSHPTCTIWDGMWDEIGMVDTSLCVRRGCMNMQEGEPERAEQTGEGREGGADPTDILLLRAAVDSKTLDALAGKCGVPRSSPQVVQGGRYHA